MQVLLNKDVQFLKDELNISNELRTKYRTLSDLSSTDE